MVHEFGPGVSGLLREWRVGGATLSVPPSPEFGLFRLPALVGRG